MSDIKTVILLEEEPILDVFTKWFAWLIVMVLFTVALIYFSNYFVNYQECMMDKPVDTILKDINNRRRFDNSL